MNVCLEQHQRIIQQIKYLIKYKEQDIKQEIIEVLNKLYPFTQFPINFHIPIELLQTNNQTQQIITQDLKLQLNSYFFIILKGSLIIKRQNNQITQQKYLHSQNIRNKLLYNFDHDKSLLKSKNNTVYLKIHNIWLKKAKSIHQQKQKNYIRKKLIQIDFFRKLSFQQFHNICKKAFVKNIAPEQVLIPQNQKPYHMYIIVQGQLSIQKKIKFCKQQNIWNEVQQQILKNSSYGNQLFEYLVREPKFNSPYFQVNFSIKQIQINQIICGKQTLLQHPLQYTIKSNLNTKLICIKYPDLYLFNQDRLAQIRNLPYLCQINSKKIRKQYYSLINWNQYKNFLRKQNQLSKLQRKSFNDYLRKQVNLVEQRYFYFPQKIVQGKIIQNPGIKAIKLKSMINLQQ